MCQTLTAALPDLKTQKDRSFDWDNGVLVVHGRRVSDVYLVEEDCSEPFPGRTWLLAKQTGEGDVYRVESGPRGWHCSCLGFGRGGACKHSGAIRELHAAGAFDPMPLPVVEPVSEAELDAMAFEFGQE